MVNTSQLANTLQGIDSLRNVLGDQVLEELIDLFVADGTQRLGALKGALDRGEATVLADEAHALRGSSSSLGVVQVAALCGQLEKRGRAGIVDGTAEIYESLASEFDRVTGRLALARSA